MHILAFPCSTNEHRGRRPLKFRDNTEEAFLFEQKTQQSPSLHITILAGFIKNGLVFQLMLS